MRGRPCVFSLIAVPQRGQNRFVHPAMNSTMSNDSNSSMSSKLHGVFQNVLETRNKKAAMDSNRPLPKKGAGSIDLPALSILLDSFRANADPRALNFADFYAKGGDGL